MDAKKLGKFIAEQRKNNHLTQAALAEKLHVTDKAVSKWERGLGFPDINTIEPLAEALGVSVLEIMKAEKIEVSLISNDEVTETLLDTFELVKIQRIEERKNIIKIFGGITLILSIVFLLDNIRTMGYFVIGVYLPVICLISGIVLLIYCIFRKKNKLSCLRTFVVAVILLSLPLMEILFLFLVGMLGIGPVPN